MKRPFRFDHTAGIYQIRNLVNGALYVGSSKQLSKRFSAHRRALETDRHHSEPLTRAWAKYGPQAFTFEVLAYCDRAQTLFYEQRALDVLQPRYNTCRVAGTCEGLRHSDERKALISRQHKRKKHSEETKRKMSESSKGRPKSAEHRAKMSLLRKGAHVSAETRAKLSAVHTGRIRGPHTAEHKAKIGARTRERARLSPDQVREIRLLRQGGIKAPIVGDIYGISCASVNDILAGRTYAHVVD